MALRDLRFKIFGDDETESGFASVEKRASTTFERVAAAAAAVGLALLKGITDALDVAEERLNQLEIRAGRTSPFEQALQRDLVTQGFSDSEAAIAVQRTRALGVTGADAALLSGDVAALERAGVNTRFLPQLSQAFGIDDAGVLSNQLNAAFDVGTRSGVDVEELLSEIADNPQVYGQFATIPQATDFLTRQGLIPSESTIRLEQGQILPDQRAVQADINALSTVSPTTRERLEGIQATANPFLRAVPGALEAIPLAGESLGDITDISGEATLRASEALGFHPGDRTRPQRLGTFNSPVGSVLDSEVRAGLIGDERRVATEERITAALETIAGNSELAKRSGPRSGLDIPG